MIGQTLGHYRIIEKIGAGGMGIVYRARDERLDRDVALKVLPAGTLADETARKRFRKEALALSQLNHPNIATVHDFDSQQGVDFLVMELIAGVTLGEKLAAGALAETRLYVGLGDKEQALAWLEKAYAEHSGFQVMSLKVEPILDSLRLDPRFSDLLRRLGLPRRRFPPARFSPNYLWSSGARGIG